MDLCPLFFRNTRNAVPNFDGTQFPLHPGSRSPASCAHPPPPSSTAAAVASRPISAPKNGVVVVGFIGRRHHDVSHLINKIIDSKIFGSGSLDTPFRFEPDKINPETRKWFESRKLSFYHDEEQRILYLQFSSVRCPATEEGLPETRFESVMEEQEFGDLQGLLFMFSGFKRMNYNVAWVSSFVGKEIKGSTEFSNLEIGGSHVT
ncbi:UNVERIFIED_CONTAM: hypothetical protein Scaly_0362600 [Sesamum calycinum]|uniref:Nonsense-mediated mRNA decay factor SMG8 n=1 Tax=Sesamum calycinum TaxID=2727403 RepID=A0AAW2SC41_9LAMI